MDIFVREKYHRFEKYVSESYAYVNDLDLWITQSYNIYLRQI